MLFSTRSLLSACAFSSVISAARIPQPLVPRQDACVGGTVLVLQEQITVYTIAINTYVPSNTTLIINQDITINISNAPTALTTYVTATVTSTQTISQTNTITAGTTYTTLAIPAASSSSAVVSQSSFQLAVLAGSKKRWAGKRQAVIQYVDTAGRLNGDASAASNFLLSNDQLFANGNQVSVPSNVTSAPILGASNQSISTTFALSNGALLWTNQNFYNSLAQFCVRNGSVYSIFVQSLPDGCTAITLTAVTAQGGSTVNSGTVIAPSSSSSSGLAGSGAQGVSVSSQGVSSSSSVLSASGSQGVSSSLSSPVASGSQGVSSSSSSPTVSAQASSSGSLVLSSSVTQSQSPASSSIVLSNSSTVISASVSSQSSSTSAILTSSSSFASASSASTSSASTSSASTSSASTSSVSTDFTSSSFAQQTSSLSASISSQSQSISTSSSSLLSAPTSSVIFTSSQTLAPFGNSSSITSTATPASSSSSLSSISSSISANPTSSPSSTALTTSSTSSSAVLVGNIGSGVVTISSTASSSGVVSSTSATVPSGSAFVISTNSGSSRKRSTQFLGSNGNLTTDSTKAATMFIQNGQLYADGKIVSTAVGTTSQVFIGSVGGSISTTFSLVSGSFAWSNTSFYGGVAQFCVADEQLIAYFTEQLPAACATLALTTVPVTDLGTATPTYSYSTASTTSISSLPTSGLANIDATSLPTVTIIPTITSAAVLSSAAAASSSDLFESIEITTTVRSTLTITLTRTITLRRYTTTESDGSVQTTFATYTPSTSVPAVTTVLAGAPLMGSSVPSAAASTTPPSAPSSQTAVSNAALTASITCPTAPTSFYILLNSTTTTTTPTFLYDTDLIAEDTLSLTTTPSSAQIFTISQDYQQLSMYVGDGTGGFNMLASEQDSVHYGAQALFFTTPDRSVPGGDFLAVTAAVDGSCNLGLSLTYNGTTAAVTEVCDGTLYLLSSATSEEDKLDCYPVDLIAVPASAALRS